MGQGKSDVKSEILNAVREEVASAGSGERAAGHDKYTRSGYEKDGSFHEKHNYNKDESFTKKI